MFDISGDWVSCRPLPRSQQLWLMAAPGHSYSYSHQSIHHQGSNKMSGCLIRGFQVCGMQRWQMVADLHCLNGSFLALPKTLVDWQSGMWECGNNLMTIWWAMIGCMNVAPGGDRRRGRLDLASDWLSRYYGRRAQPGSDTYETLHTHWR